ncbi:MAG: acyl-CoA dehydrogenase [Nocardia sp.]|uniref:acyl-CoA dehydrogenase family protein n=1 Tax=Nocardia sp. TaxID=1821 RepID=UPI002622B751|nr:acyl-CoA dehydrogenase family protein [Nocardia sp.]MCU1639986.1 acyl-CoA dehydrogenase [Nocardia sp.]
MDFSLSPRAQSYLEQLDAFIDTHVHGALAVYHEQHRSLTEQGRPHDVPPVVEELKAAARARGLWNLFLPDADEPAHGLTVLDYAPIAERTGWYPDVLPEVLNCSAPDSGNIELLHMFGSPEQKAQWLKPLLAGDIRSAFAMTEPDVASSDATNIRTSIVRDGDTYVINGRKWWITGAADPRCQVLVVMGVTDSEAAAHAQQSFVLVPRDTPGVELTRSLTAYGYTHQPGHAELTFHNVRVPVTNLIGAPGSGFALAQARLGPGRIHHCMRAIGMAEHALALMSGRAKERVAFGRPLAQQGVVRQWVAEARIAIEQARLLVLKTAWLIQNGGPDAARSEIAAIKASVPRTVCDVIDHAIQLHGAAGVGPDTTLAELWVQARTMRLADGPDEVHLRSVARVEFSRPARTYV